MPLTTITTSPANVHHHPTDLPTQPATVVLRGSPAGWDWGWSTDPEPLFHLVPIGPEHQHVGKVYLEDRFGRKVFEPEGKIPTDVLDKLARMITRHRKAIETAWCRQVAGMGSLQALIEPDGLHIQLVVHAGTPRQRTRFLRVNWPMLLGGRDPEPDDVKIDADTAELVVGDREAEPIRVPLRLLVLVGRTAVFDVRSSP
jgi:hypothetical protein